MTSISGNFSNPAIHFGKYSHFQSIALQQLGQDPVAIVKYAQEVKPERTGLFNRTMSPECEKASAIGVAAAVLNHAPLSKGQLREITEILEHNPDPIHPELFQAYMGAFVKKVYPPFPPIDQDPSHIFGAGSKGELPKLLG
jgi:hypothetical protein